MCSQATHARLCIRTNATRTASPGEHLHTKPAVGGTCPNRYWWTSLRPHMKPRPTDQRLTHDCSIQHAMRMHRTHKAPDTAVQSLTRWACGLWGHQAYARKQRSMQSPVKAVSMVNHDSAHGHAFDNSGPELVDTELSSHGAKEHARF